MQRRTLAILCLAPSLGALVAAPAWWALSRPDTDVGEVPLAAVTQTSEPAPTAARGRSLHQGLPGLTSPGARAQPPARPARVRTTSARLVDAQPVLRPAPTELRIPSIDLRAPVAPVGIDKTTGEVAVPPDRSTVAWYRFGATPGAPGSTVLAGHVDYGAGVAVFARLHTLEPGALVVLRLADGTTQRYRVAARRLYDKQRLPEQVFATTGRSILTLITCGGSYSADERSYDANVVVYAVPLDAAPSEGRAARSRA